MKKQMLGKYLKNREPNVHIRASKVKDVAKTVGDLKWNFAGNVAMKGVPTLF